MKFKAQDFERLKNKTILFVDNEADTRDNISSILKCFFKEVYTAIDGYDALDKYDTNFPDIIMTELKIPNISGFELIEELKKRAPSIFTIILSGNTDINSLLTAIHTHIDRYIIKPLVEEELFIAFNAYFKKIDNEEPQIIKISPSITIDFDKSELIKNTNHIHLNKKENQVLRLLCKDMNKTVNYEQFEYQIWGSEIMSLSAIRSVVRDLRKKLGKEYIINVSGRGYKIK